MSERSWYRLASRASRAMRYGSKSPLRVAYLAMVREQYPQLGACDYCGEVAPFEWERTAKQIRKIERTAKLRGSALVVSRRCSAHVPYFAPDLAEHYRDARVVRVSERSAEVA